ncbi:hypothetical protein Scep_011819 [Stephania cephalantha]|uniref:Uncharacterized protein n=1 Tax=Stephania cephalantha TaxID=152367 RepID=A0AAP0JDU3_9MAGN
MYPGGDTRETKELWDIVAGPDSRDELARIWSTNGVALYLISRSTRFEDMRNIDEERVLYQRPAANKPVICIKWREDDLDLAEFSSRGKKSIQPSSRQHVYRPEASTMDYVIRPHSKIDPDEVRARAKLAVCSQQPVEVESSNEEKASSNKDQCGGTGNVARREEFERKYRLEI